MFGSLQHDENDCGLACIFTVCKRLRIHIDETELRKSIVLGGEGLSLYGITEVFRMVGIESQAIEASAMELYELLASEGKPVIAMICENHEDHYIVIDKQSATRIYLWDPNKGRRRLAKEDFDSIWSGYAISITAIRRQSQSHAPRQSMCFRALLQHKGLLFLLLLFSVLLMALSMATVFLYRNVIDSMQTGLHAFTATLKTCFLAMGACYVAVSALSLLKESLLAYFQKELEVTLQNQFLDSLLHMPIQKRDDYASGGILDRYHRLPMVIETMTTVFSSVILEGISLIAGTIILVNINQTMFCMVLLIVASYLLAFMLSRQKLFELSKRIMDQESMLLTHIKETIENLISLKSFDHATYRSKISKEMEDAKCDAYHLNRYAILFGELLEMIENLTMLCILAYGIGEILSGRMSLGTLLAFESFIGLFLSPIKNLLGILPSLQETILTFRRMEDIFAYSPAEKANVTAMPSIRGNIEVNGLEVAYGFGNPILHGLTFQVTAGDMVFLMGPSGCGKSTLAKALAGIIREQNGTNRKESIRWDGHSDLEEENLSRQVLYLSQEAEIFSGSIRDNIVMWNPDYDKERLEEVVEAMGIHQMMRERDLSLDSVLLENGSNLSGGEKQRIALARAMMRAVPIYILDEATCHLDRESERGIMDYIRKSTMRQTCIVISHNPSLIQDGDKVLSLPSNQ